MKAFDTPKNDFWYLATVYRKHPHGLGAAYIDACQISAKLWQLGIPNFCPIAMGHGMSVHGGLPTDDHEFWMWVDRHFMTKAYGLLLPQMVGWDESQGIQEELDVFLFMDRPVVAFKPSRILPEIPDGAELPEDWIRNSEAVNINIDKSGMH